MIITHCKKIYPRLNVSGSTLCTEGVCLVVYVRISVHMCALTLDNIVATLIFNHRVASILSYYILGAALLIYWRRVAMCVSAGKC